MFIRFSVLKIRFLIMLKIYLNRSNIHVIPEIKKKFLYLDKNIVMNNLVCLLMFIVAMVIYRVDSAPLKPSETIIVCNNTCEEKFQINIVSGLDFKTSTLTRFHCKSRCNKKQLHILKMRLGMFRRALHLKS